MSNMSNKGERVARREPAGHRRLKGETAAYRKTEGLRNAAIILLDVKDHAA